MSNVKNLSGAARKRLVALVEKRQEAHVALQSFLEYLQEEYEVDDTWQINSEITAFVKEQDSPAVEQQVVEQPE